MTNEELKQLVESNARTAQAMLDSMAEARHERQELQEGTIRLQNVVERLTIVQEGINSSKSEALSNFSIAEEDIVAMANDPEIQAELAAINREFAVAEMDGLENL